MTISGADTSIHIREMESSSGAPGVDFAPWHAAGGSHPLNLRNIRAIADSCIVLQGTETAAVDLSLGTVMCHRTASAITYAPACGKTRWQVALRPFGAVGRVAGTCWRPILSSCPTMMPY